MSDIKEAVLSIQNLTDGSPLIRYLRPWLVITDLEFQDAVNVSFNHIKDGLRRVSEKLSGSVDIFDDDQLREAACRCLKEITLHGDIVEGPEGPYAASFKMEWKGDNWHYISDPRLRQKCASKSYGEVRKAGLEYLGR